MAMTFGNSSVFRQCLAEFFAEFLGTFLLVFMGNNAVAVNILTSGTGGNAVTVYIGYGLGLFLGILVSGSVSGGHLNPAVTIAGAIVKKFQWSRVFHYIIAQYLGAFVASCLTYLVYYDSIEAYHAAGGANMTTASIFATYPKENLTIFGSIVDQVLGTMVLVIAIYAVTDDHNGKVPVHLVSFYVTLTLIGIGCSLGVNQGFAVNPARDLSPRFFTYIAGWGSNVFGSNSYWYVPIVGPHIGAVIGGVAYVLFVDKLRSTEEEDPRFAVTPPEMKQFSYTNPVCSTRDEKKDVYTCYL